MLVPINTEMDIDVEDILADLTDEQLREILSERKIDYTSITRNDLDELYYFFKSNAYIIPDNIRKILSNLTDRIL